MKALRVNNDDILIEELTQKGVYSGIVGRQLYRDIHYDASKSAASGGILGEAIDYQFETEESGGIITFSTDVNAVELSSNRLINWIKQKVATLSNRLKANKHIDKIAHDNGAVAWTVGHFLDGRYTAKNGKGFGEKSLSIEIIGITSTQLQSIAEDLCDAFKQETVLVKDFISGKIYLANKEKAQ